MEKIHRATQQHFEQLVDIWEASVRATHDFLSEDDINHLRPQVLTHYLPEVDAYYVTDDEENILGFVGIADKKIEMLFIHPDSRGKGIGKTLVNFALNELDADVLDVNEQNQQAVAFYLHMGFKVTGRSETDSMGNPFPLLHLAYN